MAAAPSATAESQGYGASGGAISGSENKQTISLLDIMKARAAKPQTPRPEMKAIRVSVDLLTIAVKTGELMLVRDFNVRMLDANTRVALVMLMGPQKSNTGKPVPVPVIGSSCVAVAGPWPWPDGRMASPLVVAGWPGRGRMAGWPGWPAR